MEEVTQFLKLQVAPHVEHLRESILALQAEHAATSRQAVSLQALLDNERNKVGMLESENSVLRSLNDQLQSTMLTELHAAKDYAATLAALEEQGQRHAQERRTLTEQVNTLQEQLQCANDDVKTHAEAAGAAHNALESLQKEMHQTEQAASQTAAQLRAALDTKEEELAQCSAQCASLQEALEAVQRQLQAAQGAVAQLQERHAQLKQELDKERTQAVNAVGSNAAAMWKNKYIKIRTQLDALRQERQEAS